MSRRCSPSRPSMINLAIRAKLATYHAHLLECVGDIIRVPETCILSTKPVTPQLFSKHDFGPQQQLQVSCALKGPIRKRVPPWQRQGLLSYTSVLNALSPLSLTGESIQVDEGLPTGRQGHKAPSRLSSQDDPPCVRSSCYSLALFLNHLVAQDCPTCAPLTKKDCSRGCTACPVAGCEHRSRKL